MVEILLYLAKHCAFLFRPGWFRFVDSRVDESFGGDAYVVLASDSLRLRFVRDCGQLLLDFQSTERTGEKHWFSIDVVQRLITGEKRPSAELDAEYAAFLEENLTDIERRFGQNNLSETVKTLRELERVRAKELFG
jgi:hypothetical protein